MLLCRINDFTAITCVPYRLSEPQKVGLKYVREFEARIPRAEVALMEELLLREAAELVRHRCAGLCPCFSVTQLISCLWSQSPKLHVVVCGSYRRGLPDCGDVDVLVTHPDFVRFARARIQLKCLHWLVCAV